MLGTGSLTLGSAVGGGSGHLTVRLGATLGISNAIKSSPIKNAVAWVRPQAYSGGAIIALAAREIVVTDPGSMGDALPILMGGAIPFESIPEHERQKDEQREQ